jgi:hypothetical protein
MKIRIYRTIILPVVYGRESWSLSVWEENGVWVFESWVLRIIFGPKRKGLSEGWRKLHGEDLHNLHSSVDIIWVMETWTVRWKGHIASMGEMRSACKV